MSRKSLCHAKINLFLKLLGKRPDGFHELESLFAFLDLADELSVEIKNTSLQKDSVPRAKSRGWKINSHPLDFARGTESSAASIEFTGEFASFIDPKKNLFTEILDFFSVKFGITKNLHIKIKKNIPVGGGLGGGSSNAASFMKILNEIFMLNLSKTELQKISLNFGSDIAFFFEDRASIVKGRGEIIENFPEFEPISALLLHPKIHLSTKEVFQEFGGNFSTKIPTKELLKKDAIELINYLPNDLEKPAISIAPEVEEILTALKNFGANPAKMSGSGASCFGIFFDEKKLDEAEQKFRENFPNFFVKKVKILSHV